MLDNRLSSDSNNMVAGYRYCVLGTCIMLMAFLTDPHVMDRQITVKMCALAVCITLCIPNKIPRSKIMLF